MLKQFILGGVALAIVSGVALAENSAANPPPAQPDAQVADTAGNPPPAVDPQGGDEQGWWHWGKHRHGGRHGEFGQGRMAMAGQMGGPDGPGPMGGPGMMMDHQGFRLHLGQGIDVGVTCGKEVLKDCVAEAQPLIDAAKAAATAQAPAAAKTP